MSIIQKEVEVPDHFLCPITGEVMRNPLMSIHGFNFERSAIFEWLGGHSTCPMTREPLTVSKLVTNCALREKIKAWCAAHVMEHLLATPVPEGQTDMEDPRLGLIGIRLTDKQRKERSQHHVSERRQIRRALTRMAHRGQVEFRLLR
jgi:hypothetical protein